ncbi:MAG: hypothetical protein M1814_004107 [Vezdaea aestivalis]|nr:MAG: hypothetical protein M1814_004107 [Vezdaea aestivalis]
MGLYRTSEDLNIGDLPLEKAVRAGDIQTTESLLKGVRLVDGVVKNANATGRSLYIAVHYGFTEIVDILLEYNAPLDHKFYDRPPTDSPLPVGKRAPGKRGQTALHLAAEDRRPDIVKAIVGAIPEADRKKILDFRDDFELTPLHAATHSYYNYSVPRLHQTSSAYFDVVECLLDAGANPSLHDPGNCTPAHYAYLCLESMSKDHNEKTETPDSSLIAARKYSQAVMQALYDKNHDVFNLPMGKSEWGRTCLHRAAREGWASHTKWLLDHMSAEGIARRDSKKRTAWDYACTRQGSTLRFALESAFSIRQMESDAAKSASKSNEPWSGLFLLMGDDTQLAREKDVYTFELNNRAGVVALMGRLDDQGRISEQALDFFLQDIGDMRGSHNDLRFREPSCTFEMLVEQDAKADSALIKDATKQGLNVPLSNNGAMQMTQPALRPKVPGYLSLVFPYFHGSNVTQVENWRNPDIVKNAFAAKGSARYCVSDSLEHFGISMPLTLDEYCNPVLPRKVLDERNKDQVLVWAKDLRDKPPVPIAETLPSDTGLIVVSQAWLWNIENIFVASPFESAAFAIDPFTLGDLDLGKRLPEKDSYLHSPRLDSGRRIGLILSELVNYFDQRLESPSSEPILNAYEMAITLVSQEVNAYVKMKKSRPDIDKETDFLHKINDVREELSMIKRIITQQEEVWREYTSNTWPWAWPKGLEGQMLIAQKHWATFDSTEAREMRLILRPQAQFEKYRRRIAQIDEDAERIERSILVTLDLKSKHASLDESHATAMMSAAVLGFTVITIIFTPLAFLTSLFALDPFKPSLPTKNEFGKWAVTIDFVALAFTAVIVALAIEYIMKVPVARSSGSLLVRLYNYMFRRPQTEGVPEPRVADPRSRTGAPEAPINLQTEKTNGTTQTHGTLAGHPGGFWARIRRKSAQRSESV